MSLVRKVGRRLRSIDLVIPGLLERVWLRSSTAPICRERISLPLVVIVGPPRVGSTLASQLLLSQYQFFHFNNFQHAFLRYPYLAFRFSRSFIPKRKVGFESDHGVEKGLGGLSEGIFFWAFWFDMPVTQKEPQPKIPRLQHIQRVLNQIDRDVGKPLLTAANTLSFYLMELNRRFEKLVIINMRRDPVATALSLLRGRRIFRSDPENWWSIKPSGCMPLENEDPYQQIVCQIVETYREIKRQRAVISRTPVVDVHYEELCNSPRTILSRILDICTDSSIPLTPDSLEVAIPELSVRGPQPDEFEDAKRFRELFADIAWDELWSDSK